MPGAARQVKRALASVRHRYLLFGLSGLAFLRQPGAWSGSRAGIMTVGSMGMAEYDDAMALGRWICGDRDVSAKGEISLLSARLYQRRQVKPPLALPIAANGTQLLPRVARVSQKRRSRSTAESERRSTACGSPDAEICAGAGTDGSKFGWLPTGLPALCRQAAPAEMACLRLSRSPTGAAFQLSAGQDPN